MLKRMVKYVVNELDQNDQIEKNPGLFKSYDDMLLTALLSLPHNQREKLYPVLTYWGFATAVEVRSRAGTCAST